MGPHSLAALLATLALYCTASSAHAQSSWDNAIKSAEHVAPLQDGLFGDTINFNSGALSFQVTDLQLPGNSRIAMSIGRSYVAELGRMKGSAPDPAHPRHRAIPVPRKYLFGDWDLDLPMIAGTFAEGVGWQNASATPLARCSVIGQRNVDGSPANGEPLTSNPVVEATFWRGNHLRANGKSEALLLGTVPTTPRPSAGGPWHWLTKDQWWVSCLPNADNAPGEAFLAIDPDGTRYWMTWMSQRNVGALSQLEDLGDGKAREHFLWLQEVQFLATKIVDRFGNTVRITYSNDAFARPLSIESDEVPSRRLTFAYDAAGLISSITDGARTVRYAYTTDAQGYASLSSVTLPDGSAWQYAFRNLLRSGATSGYNPVDPCARGPQNGRPPLDSYDCVGYPVQSGATTASVVHPAGARGDYTLQVQYQITGTDGYRWSYPFSVTERVTHGPGIAPMRWMYAFGPTLAQTQAHCRAGACPSRKWSDELAPDGVLTRRVFGVTPNVDHGLMLQAFEGAESASGSPGFRRNTVIDYRIGKAIGVLPGNNQARTDLFTNMRHLPAAKRVMQQDGIRHTHEVSA